jgi:poly(3-hydroxybutyrate) depolymerase
MIRNRPAIFLLMLVLVFIQMVGGETARAQARDTVASLRTRYNTVKTQAKPEGELKRKFDAFDEQIAKAAQLGRTGELRRLYAQGIALAGGKEWTPESDFTTSLALRTERVFVDPARPVGIRLEQIYMPSLELREPLSVRVALHKPGTGAGGNQPGEKLRDAGTFDGVGRDLIDNPFRFDVDLSSVPEGRAIVRAEAFEANRSLGAVTLPIEVHRGLDQRLLRLESELSQVKGFESLRAEVLYPLDYVRNVDRGRIAIGQFNVEREVTLAESALASLKGGKDPFAGKTGDFKRHYEFRDADEVMPYRLYVPASYKADRPYPLIVMLHGNGGTENTLFDGYNGQLQQLAEERGYIVVVPLGYRVDGGYGYNNGSRTAEDARKLRLSEKDVMQVLDLMKQNYSIDANRIYLGGHSMGGSGTWYMGARYAGTWAALASFAGAATPETIPPIKPTPQLIVHGDADATVSVERSRTMAATLKKLSVEHQYIEVPGGAHGGIVGPNLKTMFDFFDKHRKAQSN